MDMDRREILDVSVEGCSGLQRGYLWILRKKTKKKLVCANEEDVDEWSIWRHVIGCVNNLVKTEN